MRNGTAKCGAVLDRKTGERIATWKVTDARTNFAMLLDEASHRLFSVFRNPSITVCTQWISSL
jgi:hypothetical protein